MKKHQKLDRALDEIRKKYGEDAVQKGDFAEIVGKDFCSI